MPDTAANTAAVPELDGVFPTVFTRTLRQTTTDNSTEKERLAVELVSPVAAVAPGAASDLSLAIFAGPRKKEVLAERPFDLLHFDKLIRYELSCSFCTWQWLAKGLLGYLKVIHTVVRDWGMAIILLVLTVRPVSYTHLTLPTILLV